MKAGDLWLFEALKWHWFWKFWFQQYGATCYTARNTINSLRETAYEERTHFHVMDLWTGLHHVHTISQNGFCSMGVCEVTSLRRLKQWLCSPRYCWYTPPAAGACGWKLLDFYNTSQTWYPKKMCKQNGTAQFLIQ